MRSIAVVVCLAIPLVACGPKKGGDDGAGDDGGGGPDACAGLQCNVVNCAATGKPPTTLTGTVFAPNGTLPLFGINVYVPNADPGPFIEGVQCDTCSEGLPGSPIVAAVSDDKGQFRLENVPSGDNIPLVITIGKWRRQLTIAHVESCQDTAIATAETRLPRTKAEGDIPKIAITTGSADSMECLIRKLGIDDTEITNGAGAGRIHLYAGNGVDAFKSGFPGGSGQSFTGAEPFWNSLTTVKTYDIVILSCEGGQEPANNNATNKSQAALDAMKAYADVGGRVFASHWHNIWVGGNFQGNPALKPAVWSTIATWTAADGNPGNPILIDEVSNPKGTSFANWMLNVQGSTVRDQIQLSTETGGGTTGRRTALSIVDPTRAERWVKTSSGNNPQMFQFTTPNEAAAEQRCGKVVFTDMHVTGTPPLQNGDYPDHCIGGASNLTLTPQEKALAFMFFDIASCVGVIQ
jgi:hypothetical protein